jgi:hypothetical protein
MHQKESENSTEFQPYLGRAVGAYLLQSIIGVGGMGAVFVATHTRLDKKVAVKLIRSSFRHQKEAASRFFSEAKAAAAIGHENIIDVFDVGEDVEVGPFLAMELLDTSESLDSLLMREGPLPLARISKITLQIANALFATHASGLVHCDLKPSNILLIKALGQADVVKIIDFGIAREAPSPTQDPLISSLLVLGTPKFMSPEQAIGRRPDGRSDQYALGLLVYTMLTGKPPFDGTPAEVMKRQYHDPPASIRAKRQDVTALLEVVILRALAKKPEDRFSSIKQFGESLYDAIEKLSRPQTSPWLPAAPPAPAQPKPNLSSDKAMFGGEGGLTSGQAIVKPAPLSLEVSQYKAMLSDDSGMTGGAAPASPQIVRVPLKQVKEPAVDVSQYKAMFEGGTTGAQAPTSSQKAETKETADIFSLLGKTSVASPVLPSKPPPVFVPLPVEALRPDLINKPEEPPRDRATYLISGLGALLLGIGLYWAYLSGYLASTNLPTYPRQATSKKVIPSFVPQTAPVIVDEKKDPKLTPKNNLKPTPEATIPEALPPHENPPLETPKLPELIDVPDFGTPEVKSLPPSSQKNK